MYTHTQRKVAWLGLVMAAGLAVFWTLFFTVGLSPENPPPGYEQFESAFPFPDLVMAFLLALSAVGVMRNHPRAATGMVACGGALIFLGLLDFSFNIQNGMYQISPVETAMNVFIQLACLVSGGIFIYTYGLSQRDATGVH